ncbi:MAG TPA: hypothetical protein VEJ84_07885, partial [Acidimicrobiales bacterium]|nr:hypothetical protein [Acidimicrobiales bacterium]
MGRRRVIAVCTLLLTGGSFFAAPWSGSVAPALRAQAAPLVGASRGARGCPDSLADRLRTTNGAGQLVTVEAANYQTTVAEVALWQRDGLCWELA